jgi:hypothetical protein
MRAPSQRARSVFIETCQGNDALRQELEALLNHPVDTGDFRNFVEQASPQFDGDLTGKMPRHISALDSRLPATIGT